jgi:cell wall assembly regulator SMI1
MSEIRKSWSRIESWYRANAPADDFFLEIGASDDPEDEGHTLQILAGRDVHRAFSSRLGWID